MGWAQGGECTGSRNEVSVKLPLVQAETQISWDVLPYSDILKAYFVYSLLTLLCPSPLSQVFAFCERTSLSGLKIWCQMPRGRWLHLCLFLWWLRLEEHCWSLPCVSYLDTCVMFLSVKADTQTKWKFISLSLCKGSGCSSVLKGCNGCCCGSLSITGSLIFGFLLK